MRNRLLFLVLAIFILSCNPDEPDPSFIYVDEYSFSTGPGEGTDSEKFTEIWAYANDQVIGVFDLPARIPVLNQGNTEISLFAGIKNNGISTMRIKYPFIEGEYYDLQLTPLSVDTLRPSFNYFDNLEIEQKDYDGNTPNMLPLSSNQGNLSMLSNDDRVFEGDRCGYYTLPGGSSLLSFKDDQNLQLTSGAVSFLEMNYSCNTRFSVGLIANQSGVENKKLVVVINPTTESSTVPVWNKIYIDLGYIVQQSPGTSYFETYFEASPLYSGQDVTLFLDNLKVVHF